MDPICGLISRGSLVPERAIPIKGLETIVALNEESRDVR